MVENRGQRQRETHDKTAVTGQFTVSEYDAETVFEIVPRWQRLDARVQLRTLPVSALLRKHTTSNTTCIENHRLIVDALDATQPAPPPIRSIAVGKSETPPEESDRSLNSEVARIDTNSYNDEGSSITVTAVLGIAEGNVDTDIGEALREAGVYAGGLNNEPTYFLNHSLFSQPIDKDETVIATVAATLTFDAA